MSRVRFMFEDDMLKTTRRSQHTATSTDADTLRHTSFLFDESANTFHQPRVHGKHAMAHSWDGLGFNFSRPDFPCIHGSSRHAAGYSSDPDLGYWMSRPMDPVRSVYYKSYEVDHRASTFWRNKLLKRYMTSVMVPTSLNSMS